MAQVLITIGIRGGRFGKKFLLQSELLLQYTIIVNKSLFLSKIFRKMPPGGQRVSYPVNEKGNFMVRGKLNITESRRTEDALQASEKRFKELVEITTDWVWEVDEKGVYTYVSPKVRDLLGYEPEEIIGKTPFDLMPEEEAEKMTSFFKDKVKENKPFYRLENINRHKDGHLVVLETNGIPLFDESGKLKGYRGIDRDITERKHTDQQRDQLRDQLLSKLEIKNQELQRFSSIIRHDIGNPLLSIQAFSSELIISCDQLSKLLSDQQIDDKVKKQISAILSSDMPESIGYIQNSAAEISKLLEGLKELAAVDRISTNIKPLEMNKIAKQVVGEMKSQIQNSGALVTTEPLPECLGDEMQIRQVFSNLLSNALKHLDPQRKGRVHVSGRVDRETSVYTVEDNGIGIAPEHQKKVFEPFYRVDSGRTDAGEGLGLSIVAHIVTRHNGRIWLESEPGKGSKFNIALPRRQLS